MSGLEQALQSRSHSLPQVLQQTAAAHGPMLMQIFQNFNLPRRRGAHGPGRVRAQEAKFLAGRVRAGGQHTGRARTERLGQFTAFFRLNLADLPQAQRRGAARFQAVQADARAAQPLRQHMAQDMPRLHALAAGQVQRQSQQVRRQQGFIFQRPADRLASHIFRQIRCGAHAQQDRRPQSPLLSPAQGHGQTQTGLPECRREFRRQRIGQAGIGRA